MKKIFLVVGMMFQFAGLAKADVVTLNYCAIDSSPGEYSDDITMIRIADGDQDEVNQSNNSKLACAGRSNYPIPSDNLVRNYIYDQKLNKIINIRNNEDCENIWYLMATNMNVGFTFQIDTVSNFVISLKKNPNLACKTEIQN